MEFSYRLGEFKDSNYVFYLNDGRWINIDLSNKFPKYRLPMTNLGNEYWQFTIIKSKSINPYYKLGDIHYFKREFIRKFNTCCRQFERVGITYRLTKQTELDKYEYRNSLNTDNAKLYAYIYQILETDVKEKSKVKYYKNGFVEIAL